MLLPSTCPELLGSILALVYLLLEAEHVPILPCKIPFSGPETAAIKTDARGATCRAQLSVQMKEHSLPQPFQGLKLARKGPRRR